MAMLLLALPRLLHAKTTDHLPCACAFVCSRLVTGTPATRPHCPCISLPGNA